MYQKYASVVMVCGFLLPLFISLVIHFIVLGLFYLFPVFYDLIIEVVQYEFDLKPSEVLEESRHQQTAFYIELCIDNVYVVFFLTS